jgi:hypothetical protein
LIRVDSQEENKMSKYALTFAVGAVVLFGGIAQGQLVSFSSEGLYSWSYSGAVVTQSISDTIPLNVAMTAEADSTFTIVSTTTNETGYPWTGYIITLDPTEAAKFVEGTAGSIAFSTVLYPDPYRLEFWDGQVLPGKLAVFQFDISVPDGSPYTFRLTHQPIPEPATFALLGLGALVLVAGRKK